MEHHFFDLSCLQIDPLLRLNFNLCQSICLIISTIFAGTVFTTQKIKSETITVFLQTAIIFACTSRSNLLDLFLKGIGSFFETLFYGMFASTTFPTFLYSIETSYTRTRRIAYLFALKAVTVQFKTSRLDTSTGSLSWTWLREFFLSTSKCKWIATESSFDCLGTQTIDSTFSLRIFAICTSTFFITMQSSLETFTIKFDAVRLGTTAPIMRLAQFALFVLVDNGCSAATTFQGAQFEGSRT